MMPKGVEHQEQVEYLIIYLYSDGSFECDAVYKQKIGEAVSLDGLARQNWVIESVGQWIHGEARKLRWAVTVLRREVK